MDFHRHLPPYRSLLSPEVRYDYQLHLLIPLSPHELNTIRLKFKNQLNQPKFKMKYKSLLNDVNRKITLKISNTRLGNPFKSLPIEVQYHILLFLSLDELRITMFVNKDFYKMSKKFLYKNVTFDSTYRFAQFITVLRINPRLGNLVESVDLSTLKPCNYESSELSVESSLTSTNSDIEFVDTDKVKAGWRDWKFVRNPLYSTQALTRIHSNASSINSHKKKKLNFTFLRKRHKEQATSNQHSNSHQVNITHPSINRYLLNYSNTRDIPIGYMLHLLNLCPNLISIDLGNLQLSVDYEIHPSFVHKFHTFDIVNNYPKNYVYAWNDLDDSNSIYNFNMSPTKDVDSMSMISSRSVSSKKSKKPVWKYNSLLSPPPNLNYLQGSDGKLYMSDLNLRSVNQNYLVKLKESDILKIITKMHRMNVNFEYLNLSSMVWLNKKLIKAFLNEFLTDAHLKLVIDLTNSGMYKDLKWAQKIDLTDKSGQQLVKDIMNDSLLNDWEVRMRDDRMRRGRIAENYLH